MRARHEIPARPRCYDRLHRAPVHSGGGALRRRGPAAQAAVETAKINLGFTEIRSPVDGIVGVAQAQLGDFVGPSSAEPLTAVSKLDPIRVAFPVSEQDYLRFASRIQEALATRNFTPDALELILADGSIYPYRGTGYPAGLGIDPRTGTITVKGVFPNPRNLLRPGQYARVRVETDVRRGATTVPQRALQDLQGLAQITVVGPDEKVEVRTVQPGPSSGTLRVIEKGVAPGESVIVEGFQKVRPGMIVSPKPAPPELAGAPPASGPAPEVATPPPGAAQATSPSAREGTALPDVAEPAPPAVRSSRWSSPS